MTLAEKRYLEIANRLEEEHAHVSQGKMMSAPGIKYKNKVFAFFYQEKMTFKLGKNFDINAQGITNYTFLSPFKNKPPMKAWFQITYEDEECWDALAYIALEKMKEVLD